MIWTRVPFVAAVVFCNTNPSVEVVPNAVSGIAAVLPAVVGLSTPPVAVQSDEANPLIEVHAPPESLTCIVPALSRIP